MAVGQEIGNPTCQRGSYSTRHIAPGHAMVTRSVNEGATAHAPSLIRSVNYPGSSALTLRVTMLITGRRPRKW